MDEDGKVNLERVSEVIKKGNIDIVVLNKAAKPIIERTLSMNFSINGSYICHAIK